MQALCDGGLSPVANAASRPLELGLEDTLGERSGNERAGHRRKTRSAPVRHWSGKSRGLVAVPVIIDVRRGRTAHEAPRCRRSMGSVESLGRRPTIPDEKPDAQAALTPPQPSRASVFEQPRVEPSGFRALHAVVREEVHWLPRTVERRRRASTRRRRRVGDLQGRSAPA